MAVSSYAKSLLKQEASLILATQNLIGEDNAYFLKISKLCDTSYAIAILFPVFASLDTKLGFQVLLVSSVTEWANVLLKWLLAEGRPYWWIKEEKVKIPLRQSSVTCETGPGSPSGHVMGTAALGYVFLQWLLIWLGHTVPTERVKMRKFATYFLWFLYLATVTLVSISRVNIAAHFPHQCVLGAVLGFLLAVYLVSESKWSLWSRLRTLAKWKMIALAILFSMISGASYAAHHLFGFDAGWSIKMAFKWCLRPETVSVYTTPIYSLVRDSGCFFGMALASPLKERKFYPIVGATVTTLFFVGTRMLRPMMPTNDPFQFYMFHLLDNFFISVCLLTVIPFIASLVVLKEKQN
ncbi:glucose-6-Phosphatase [Rhodnius prolixus]|uniref:glucose-6-Phosphatase n=1 Tax=Rhodnius prolixus TaxID=13249 RepID=UPI003D1882E2